MLALAESKIKTSADNVELREQLAESERQRLAEVVKCSECIYWQDRRIKLNDGTYRNYTNDEHFVPISVGINIGSYCTRFDEVLVRGYRNGEPSKDCTKAWCQADDCCSRGIRKTNTREEAEKALEGLK